jgi:hypothetical protein
MRCVAAAAAAGAKGADKAVDWVADCIRLLGKVSFMAQVFF